MKRILIAISVFLLLTIGATAAWLWQDLRTPISHTKAGQYIEIPLGSSPNGIVKKLVAAGIVKHEWPLMFYLKLTGTGSRFKAGEYNFPSPISPLGVSAKLQEGERRLIRFTIIEGWTRWDIANAMAKVSQLQLPDAGSALQLMNNISSIRDLDPAANNLEGYLYPDTYEFPPDTTAVELIEIAVKRFRTAWKQDWTARARTLNRSPREIVTIASLIETEAKLSEERPLVASVIYNRLRNGTPLGVDSSIIYASKLEGKWRNDGKVYRSDIERRSPYNTRIYAGLPPGPIASAGESSLQAALNPAQTDYLYYVREPSRNDGAHNFYASSSDFEKGVRALRNWEQQRNAENARKKAEEANTDR